MEIKILGTGCCSRCAELYRRTQEAVSKLGLDASVEKIDDMEKIMNYNVMSLPAIVVDGKVEGKGLLTEEEVMNILKKA